MTYIAIISGAVVCVWYLIDVYFPTDDQRVFILTCTKTVYLPYALLSVAHWCHISLIWYNSVDYILSISNAFIFISPSYTTACVWWYSLLISDLLLSLWCVLAPVVICLTRFDWHDITLVIIVSITSSKLRLFLFVLDVFTLFSWTLYRNSLASSLIKKRKKSWKHSVLFQIHCLNLQGVRVKLPVF